MMRSQDLMTLTPKQCSIIPSFMFACQVVSEELKQTKERTDKYLLYSIHYPALLVSLLGPPSVTYLSKKYCLCWFHQSGTCMNRNQEILFCVHIHISCTPNRDYLNLIVNTGNAHKKNAVTNYHSNFQKKQRMGEKT